MMRSHILMPSCISTQNVALEFLLPETIPENAVWNAEAGNSPSAPADRQLMMARGEDA